MTAAMSTCGGADVAAPPCRPAAAGAPVPGWGAVELAVAGLAAAALAAAGRFATGLAAAGLAAALLAGAGLAEAGPAAAAPPKIDDMKFPNTDIFPTPDAQGPRLLNRTSVLRTVPEDAGNNRRAR
jgi:hypothetical protein